MDMRPESNGRYLIDEAFRNLVSERLGKHERLVAPPELELKRAAVALVLTDAGDGCGAALILTVRMSRLRAHSGQWAFPGGRCDAGETPVYTALREMREEIGLVANPDDVLGVLDDYPTRSGYLISPVVVWAGPEPHLRLNAEEVESVHRIPLDHVAKVQAFDFVPQPDCDRMIVRMSLWGDHLYAPAAAMLYQFREVVLAGRSTRVSNFDQPEFARR